MSGNAEQPTLDGNEVIQTDTPINLTVGQINAEQGVSVSSVMSIATNTTTVATTSTATTESTADQEATETLHRSSTSSEMFKLLQMQRQNLELQNKSIESMKILMEHVRMVSENFLEAERFRITNRGQSRMESSSRVEEIRPQVTDEVLDQNITQLDVTKVLSQSLTTLKETLDSNKKSQNYHVKRNYILTQKGDINIWFDKLKSDLNSKELLDVIDGTVEGPVNIDEQTSLKRKQIVREIITGHIDDKYYKKILNTQDPREIIEMLKESKRVEKNVTHSSVRAKLYSIRLQKNEKVEEFCNKFDSIITEYEACVNAVPLEDEEKRSAFYQAVCDAVPEIRASDVTYRRVTKKNMTLEELKATLLELEAERQSGSNKNYQQDVVVHQAKRFKSDKENELKCFRCNKNYHFQNDCPLKDTNQWFCYKCKQITNHNGKTCFQFNAGTSNRGLMKKQNFTTDRGRVRGNGRATFRGNFRGRARGNFRGRGNLKIKQKEGDKIPNANNTGTHLTINDNTNNITFIADSGATEHIINKSFILSNFEHCTENKTSQQRKIGQK
ncbi:uncharacterized protein LOC126742103 [Anthonomus grandis grandis]|uniref:uncharacterized protein LOC126742103 n=1 Tax=Anthonomus grandis grandis TaxID=2921223 RepID=UPI0021651AC1|nr:uncharacterized protein LOC126742103 [Anthonomus grandis grandis]